MKKIDGLGTARSALACALLGCAGAAQALSFNFTFVAGTSLQAQQGFIEAGQRWSNLFTDPITVNLTVGEQNLGAAVLLQAGSNSATVSYSSFRTALGTDASSSSDTLAAASLPTGSAFGMLINRTSDNPNGAGSATPYVDSAGANNQSIRLTNANAKAIGLPPTNSAIGNCTSSCDGSIIFSTAFAWDYNPNDGIALGAFDFVGIATHELGHVLGFGSGVDRLDSNSPPGAGPFLANQFVFVSPLDLFRYSAQSFASGVIDWTADIRDKYFSINGGSTPLGPSFATGRFGDGQLASHWKDNQGLGIMDPTAGVGDLLVISHNDILAFDVIGYNVPSLPVPEPRTYALMALGLFIIGIRAHRRRWVDARH